MLEHHGVICKGLHEYGADNQLHMKGEYQS